MWKLELFANFTGWLFAEFDPFDLSLVAFAAFVFAIISAVGGVAGGFIYGYVAKRLLHAS